MIFSSFELDTNSGNTVNSNLMNSWYYLTKILINQFSMTNKCSVPGCTSKGVGMRKLLPLALPNPTHKLYLGPH